MNLLYPFGFEDMRRLPCFRGKGDLCELIALIATSDEHINLKRKVLISKGKVGYPWESTRDIYQHIPPIYGLYNGFMGQYGVIFWEKMLGYLPKGTQLFPLIILAGAWKGVKLGVSKIP